MPFAQRPAASRDSSQSSRPRSRDPECLALIGAWDAVLGLRFRGQNKCACAVVGPSSGSLPQSPAADSLKPDEIPGLNHAMERKEVFDGRRIMLLGPESRSAVRLDLGSLEALIPRDVECSEQDKPKPRFLLQEIIFAHSPYEGFFHNWPCLHGIFCTDQIGFADEEFRRQNA